jgi:hypothetical protein
MMAIAVLAMADIRVGSENSFKLSKTVFLFMVIG